MRRLVVVVVDHPGPAKVAHVAPSVAVVVVVRHGVLSLAVFVRSAHQHLGSIARRCPIGCHGLAIEFSVRAMSSMCLAACLIASDLTGGVPVASISPACRRSISAYRCVIVIGLSFRFGGNA